MVQKDTKKYDYRTFTVQNVEKIPGTTGKYKLKKSKRSEYTIKKLKTKIEWPAVTNSAKKAIGVLCDSNKSQCDTKFVMREMTQRYPKKLWFFKGKVVPTTASEREAFKKKNPKMFKMFGNKAPQTKTHVELVDNSALGHANPLRDWKPTKTKSTKLNNRNNEMKS